MLLSILPSTLGSKLLSMFPEWSLPDKIAMTIQKEGWDEEFDVEKAAYKKLQCLQGHVIPVLYGQVNYNGVRALILSDIGGACMSEPGGALIDGQIMTDVEFRRLLFPALRALLACGIAHDDVKLDNYRRVEHAGEMRIMVVDLEQVDDLEPTEETEKFVGWDVDHLTGRY